MGGVSLSGDTPSRLCAFQTPESGRVSRRGSWCILWTRRPRSSAPLGVPSGGAVQWTQTHSAKAIQRVPRSTQAGEATQTTHRSGSRPGPWVSGERALVLAFRWPPPYCPSPGRMQIMGDCPGLQGPSWGGRSGYIPAQTDLVRVPSFPLGLVTAIQPPLTSCPRLKLLKGIEDWREPSDR